MVRDLLLAFTRNGVSLLGAALTTATAVLILTLFGIGLVGYEGGPYIGILTYLVLPAFFLLGLLLIPAGIWRQRKRTRRALERGEPPPTFPIIDLNKDRVRRAILVLVAATAVNLAILSVATYKGVEVMDSTAFCGTTCHTVMAPEYATYRRSPHARVKCVSCHIGPGADWFVKAKLSGAWQVASVAFDLYPRPIPTPVHDLRPARETCEQCHWPARLVGDRLKVITRYAEDEASTERKTVALLKVGGTGEGESHGIHWHVDPRIRIRYLGEPSRKVIDEVELTRADGSVKRFVSTAVSDATETGEGTRDWRVMDCVDCHNRPTHDADDKSVTEVLEVVRAAQEESGVTYVDFNTGHHDGDAYLDILEPYIVRVKEATNLLIGVQTPPHHDLARYRELRRMGVNRVSFCFELHNRARFEEVCPGKHRQYGLDRYLRAVEYCANEVGRTGREFEPWVVNGEIIAGLEPAEDSIAAIDWITKVGAVPTICVFRPLVGTALADLPPPRTEDVVPVFRRLYEACMERRLPIGVAPNVHVSLVMLPEEARWLQDDPDRFWIGELRLKLLRKAFAIQFRRDQKRAGALRAA